MSRADSRRLSRNGRRSLAAAVASSAPAAWPDPPPRGPTPEEVRAAIRRELAPYWQALRPAQRALLAAYRLCGVKSRACGAARVSVGQEWRWRTEGQAGFSPVYRDAHAEVEEGVAERLMDEAVERALHGEDKPVIHEGRVTGYVREYDNRLLLALLRVRAPERFREPAEVRHAGRVETVQLVASAG